MDVAPGRRQRTWAARDPASVGSGRRWERMEWLGVSAAVWIALTGVLVLAGAFLFHETRGTTLWFDEWEWALNRRGSSLGVFLRPHNEHFSLVPLVIYKILFATAGLRDFAPYRALVVLAHLACVLVVFVYASRRVGGGLALVPVTLILLLGPAWQNILWPFQITWLISLTAGVGAFVMLDRGDRAGDIAASGLIALSLASSGLGLPILLGLTLEVLWKRRRGEAWIVLVPLALYGLWWLFYEKTHLTPHNATLAPGFAVDGVAASIAALLGLGGHGANPPPSDAIAWGRPLGLAALGLVGWFVAARKKVPPRLAALLTTLTSFWLFTGLSRAEISPPSASRYLYVGGLFVVLAAVELARGLSLSLLSLPRRLLLAAVLVAVAVSNLGNLRDGARFLRGQSELTATDLGALETARPLVKPDYVAEGVPGSPFISIVAGRYFSATSAFGSPATSPAQLAQASEPARLNADAELIRIGEVTFAPSVAPVQLGARPTVDSILGGVINTRGACLVFTASGFLPGNVSPEVRVTAPLSGLRVTAGGSPTSISVRRFASEFSPQLPGTVARSDSGILRVRADLSRAPWHALIATTGRAAICGLR